MSIQLGRNIVFIDSFQCMCQSLDRLAGNLPDDKYIHITHNSEGDINLLKRKGVYPYEYMDSFEIFNESQLPDKSKFYSSLNDEHINDDDHTHAHHIWETFQCKTLGNYHDLYLKTDVLLLTEVFENFRKTCLIHYGLVPCYYFSAPGLAWDAMLKITGIELELISDINMSHMIQSGMRGGISYISTRYSKANNKYIKDYNPDEPGSHIIYLDANNLYGWAMTQHLPTGGFRWMTRNEIDKTNLEKYNDTNTKGLILEVVMKYPEELHDLHNDYPLAPEKIPVTNAMLSPYCNKISEKFKIKHNNTCKKLIPSLLTKERYILQHENLKLYLDLLMKLKKTHRVLEFNQSNW